MEPEERRMLKRTMSLAEENNKILKKLQSARRWAAFVRVLYWLIIISVTLAIYYSIQPFIGNFTEMYQEAERIFHDVSDFKDIIPGSQNNQ